MAGRFEGGVRFYTEGAATVKISFPENDVCCENCRLMQGEYITRRSRCTLTGEIIPDPAYMIGHECPLQFDCEKERSI